jgi:di/tricarboxylate transporter
VTRDQILICALLSGMVLLFLWDRLRYELVALLALLVAVGLGLVPADRAFSGFANPVIPLIAGALVVSAAVTHSGAIEIAVRWLGPLLRMRQLQVGVLALCVAVSSAVMKNVAALAIFIPVAIQLARRSERSPSELLMPMSFASLLGGSTTLIGTSPNILAAGLRAELVGQPYHMFDFLPVGAGVALIGILFLTFGWRLIPLGRRSPAAEPAFRIEDYTSEFRIPENSPFVGRTVGEIEEAAGGEVAVTAIVRERYRRHVPAASWGLAPEDLLVVEADPPALEQFASDGKLELVGSKELPEPAEETEDKRPPDSRGEQIGVVEAIVAAGSELIGHSAAELHLRQRYGVNVLAIGNRDRRTSVRLRRVKFGLGDTIVFQGYLDTIHETLAALGCLPLAERRLRLGQPRHIVPTLTILALAIVAAALQLLPAAIAFTAAALAVAVSGLLRLSEVYNAIEWPILILIGALIPIGDAVRTTGTTELISHSLFGFTAGLPGFVTLAVILALTMLLTPVLHHAAAVLVMGPIAVNLAQQLGYRVDPFLIAVALGAGSDFLSPIGHQSNTLVMGPGGYHFGDYWRLGLPLSLIVLAVGVPLIVAVWPLR